MKKILLVDDEKDIRESLKVSLESCGYKVITAKDGQEAIDLFRRENPHVVVMDLLMPRLDGVEAIELMRSEFPFSKIIAMSGGWIRQKDFFLQEALSSGADRAIAKPFTTETLIAIIEDVLANKTVSKMNL